MKFFVATAVVALMLAPATALAGPSIAGNFQGWNPSDPASDLTLNGNGVYELTIAAGDSFHEYKAIDGDDWGQAFPGNNQSFTPSTPQNVTFFCNLGAVPGTKQGDEYVFHSLNPPIVCGSFMSELGGADWDQTNTTLTVMSDPDNDDIWEFTALIPAGTYQFKIVLNNNWDQDTYPPSQNYIFASNGTDPVLFRYHMATNTTEVFTSAPPAVVYARVPAGCPQDRSVIEIRFSKDVEETSAETPSNYWVDSGLPVQIDTATRDDADHSIVYLGTNVDLIEDDFYRIECLNVEDLDGNPVQTGSNFDEFALAKVVFEINMHLYVDANGLPTTVHIQGDTYPLTWEQCGGCEAVDDGTGDDASAGDTTYTVTEYYCLHEVPDSTQVKYKYVVDCTTWEGDYEFGHYLDLNFDVPEYLANVWWNDVSPVDNIACDVGVLFQVHNAPSCAGGLFVRGSESPLDWSTSVELLDDGTGGDVTSGDGVYSAEVLFPTGTYRFLEYKYFCAESDTSGTYECDTYPNRTLTLDDVDGCVPGNGPTELEDLWSWCSPTTGVQEFQERSWGVIKSMYKRD
ncbi:MAG: hypothetical protein JXB46_07390 [Candidatus Eisenbacteria bacterium]|nr:hypothetical protein [Candidatus Eisenbacteria bacterium]